MKYTEQEQLHEIMQRGERLRQRKERRMTRSLAASASALFVLPAACIGAFGEAGYAGTTTVYGSFLLSAEAGGYVLAAVIAFALGVVVTVLLHRYKGRDKPDSSGEKHDE